MLYPLILAISEEVAEFAEATLAAQGAFKVAVKPGRELEGSEMVWLANRHGSIGDPIVVYCPAALEDGGDRRRGTERRKRPADANVASHSAAQCRLREE